VYADRLSRRRRRRRRFFSKKYSRRRRDGESFKNFQAAAAARVVSSPTGLDFFLIFACFFLKKLSIKVVF
jgi:hypothetical protein